MILLVSHLIDYLLHLTGFLHLVGFLHLNDYLQEFDELIHLIFVQVMLNVFLQIHDKLEVRLQALYAQFEGHCQDNFEM